VTARFKLNPAATSRHIGRLRTVLGGNIAPGRGRWWLYMLVGLFLCLPGAKITYAQDVFNVIDPDVDYKFGEQITFMATIEADPAVKEVLLFFRPDGPYDTHTQWVPIDASGRAVYIHELSQDSLPPFSTVHYWFQLETTSGEAQVSSSDSFFYEDNRFEWRSIQDPPFRVHWYTGDAIFAQKVADTAHTGLRQLSGILSDESFDLASGLAEKNLDIYIYSTISDLQSALAIGGPSWIAGHADPELGVALVSLPPGPEQTLEMERQVPHEIAHILLYTRFGPGYHSLPVWLNEGMASVTELYPNLNYQTLLSSAVENNTLIPMKDLCQGFPAGASRVIQAYAEAAGFTRYLIQEYGNRDLRSLFQAYADGKSCQRGVEEVYGVPLEQLEREWRSVALGENSLANLMPWFALPVIILGPLVLIAGLFVRRRTPRPRPDNTEDPIPQQPTS
jgi:hypothetical protein